MVWHATTVAVVGASLIAQTWLVIIGGTDVNSVTNPVRLPLPIRLVNLFSYFTIQSNVLVLITAIRLLVDLDLTGTVWRVLRLDALLGILITGLVYLVALAPLTDPSGIHAWINAGLHYLAPLLAPIGWLLFGPRPRIPGRVVLLALIWPLAWIAYTLLRGAATGWYPYPFLDVADLGLPVALRNIGVVVVVALIIIMLLKLGDRLPGGSRSDRDRSTSTSLS